MSDELLPVRTCERTYALDDLHMRSDGSGRVVEAYAAVFNSPTEVMDQDGHYHETMSPTAFDKTIRERGLNFGVLFNHGRTVDGTPSEIDSIPIGVPLEVRADERGVFTATRYLDNPRADQVLGAIKAGAIKGQSVGGRFLKSVRSYPNGRTRSALSLITRQEVAMRDYGPVTFPAYEGATILATRADQFVRAFLATPPDQRLTWLEQFEGFDGLTTPHAEPEAEHDDTAPAAVDMTEEPPSRHSARSLQLRIRAARIVRRMES